MSRFIVCYDVADDKRRQKLSELLDSYGDRVQNSVFELPVGVSLMQDCLRRLEEIAHPKEDKIAVYRLCASCDGARRYFGTIEPRIGEEEVFIV